MTAAEVAERVPDGAISKTVITNVESGRKNDLTVTELAQIASALDVPLLSLIVDDGAPWQLVDIPGLSSRDSNLTNIEYARRSGVIIPGEVHGGFSRLEVDLLERLLDAEACVLRLDWLSGEVFHGFATANPSGMGSELPSGRSVSLTNEIRDRDRAIEVERERLTDAVRDIDRLVRYLEGTLQLQAEYGRPHAGLSPAIQDRIEAVSWRAREPR